MGYLLTWGCYMVTFAPSAALFGRLIAQDPLKIILFVLGSFVWLLSLLLTSLVWFAVPPLQENHLWFALSTGIIFQEAARVAVFFLIRTAQKGLASLANPTSAQHVRVTGVMSLANSRHLLALVIGLGMGVTAALFLTMNAFAAVSGRGVVGGLPQALAPKSVSFSPSSTPRLLPLHWALSAMLISLLHVVWTILVWDSCHHFALRRDTAAAASTRATPSTPLLHSSAGLWPLPAVIAVLSHVASTATSYLSSYGYVYIAISCKVVILLVLICYAYTIIRHESAVELLKEILHALRDWLTLAAVRECIRARKNGSASAPVDEQAVADDEGVIVVDGIDSSTTTRQRRTTRT